jgi:hypothetical protein
MQLRSHPMLMYCGYALWPPVWIDYQDKNSSKTGGEIGVLRNVRYPSESRRQIFLTMEHEGAEYTGCLFMEYDFSFIAMLKVLENCIGMNIESIGSLEVPATFEVLLKVAEIVNDMSS